MPCVFPVLGLKILGFVNQSGADRRKVAVHGLAFTAGVLISFLDPRRATGGVARRRRSARLGLPAPVAGVRLRAAGVMLAFALNMSGVFEFGLSAGRASAAICRAARG